MDDYRDLETVALRGLGAVVVIWNLIDEALFLAFSQASGLPEVIAATHYARASTISPKLRLFRDFIASEAVEPDQAALWKPVLDETGRLNGVRNDLVHSPLRWSNGRIVLALSGTPENGEITVKSQEGRGFIVRRSLAHELSGAKKDFPSYDATAIWAHVEEAEGLHEQMRAILRQSA